MKTPRGAEKKLPLQGSPAKLARAIDAILEEQMRFRDLAARLARRCESGTGFRFARCRPCERRDPYAAAVVVGKDRQRQPHRTISAGGYGSLRIAQATTEEFSDFNFKEPTHLRDLAARFRPRFALELPAHENRGRREDRVRAAPAVSCAKCAQRTRTRAYRFSGNTPAFPAQWVDGLLRALPGERLFCHRRLHRAYHRNLMPAPRRQDHTTSPYASCAYVSRIRRPPHLTARS